MWGGWGRVCEGWCLVGMALWGMIGQGGLIQYDIFRGLGQARR